MEELAGKESHTWDEGGVGEADVADGEATGDGDEGGGGSSGDGRRRRRVRRKKKRPPYIGEGPLVPAPVNARDEKTFSPGWYYEPGLKVTFRSTRD